MLLKLSDPTTDPPGSWRYRCPDTGEVIRSGMFSHLYRDYCRHREARGLSVPNAGEFEDSFCRALPVGCDSCGEPAVNAYDWPDLAEALAYAADKSRERWGGYWWGMLHRHTFGEDTARWFAAFQQALPCDICKAHFRPVVVQMPLVATNQEEWLAYTWMLHQAVSRSLGKPSITLEEAREMYKLATRIPFDDECSQSAVPS